jgi:hypothetical protein
MINSIPSGCFSDEAINGLTAIDILSGKSLPVYIGPQAPNNAAVFMYYIAVMFKIFGIGATQLRLTPAFLGILAVPAFYFLIRYIGGAIPALAGSFILAVMRWHIIFSRIAFHAAFAVIAVIFVLYFALRAFYSKKTYDFIFLGITLSFSLYTYQSARLCFFVVAAFIIYAFFYEGDFYRKNLRKIAIAAAIAAVVFIPMGIYIVNNFNSFFSRQGEVSIFNKNVYDRWSIQDQSWESHDKPWYSMLCDNIEEGMLMFNYKGDANERHNLPGQPELDFFTGIFALLGFFYALTRLSNPVYFLFTSSFIIFMCAGFFTIESPQSLRTVTAIPCVVFFALVFISKFLSCFKPAKSVLTASGAILIMLLLSAYNNFDIYFNKQAKDIRCWGAFSTTEYSAGKTVKDALLSGADTSVSTYYSGHPSFKFALGGIQGSDDFYLKTAVPANPKGDNKTFMYLLPLEYLPLVNYLDELYPHGSMTYFNNKIDGQPLFFTYSMSGDDLKNFSKNISNNGVDMQLFESRGFKGKIISQRMPFILITWYDFKNYNIGSIIWKAKLKAPVSGEYEFNLKSRGYSFLNIDGKNIVSDTLKKEIRCDFTENTAETYLSRGFHDIEVKYDTYVSDNQISYGCKGLWLLWKKPGDLQDYAIPGTVLYPRD